MKVTKEGTTVKYSGQVKEVTGWTNAFPAEEASGHFLPIRLPADSVGQKLTLTGRKTGDKDITVDEDRILIQRLENLSGTELTINKEGQLYMKADVAGMLPYGKDAVTVLEHQSFGECGNTEDWYTDMKATWSGIECAITGTFTKGKKADAADKYNIGLKLSEFFGERTVNVGGSEWGKDVNYIGHKTFTTKQETEIVITCEGQTLARLTFKGATFNT